MKMFDRQKERDYNPLIDIFFFNNFYLIFFNRITDTTREREWKGWQKIYQPSAKGEKLNIIFN